MFASAPHGWPLSNSRAARSRISAARLDVGVRLGDRELHALVRADRPVEDHALAAYARRLLDEETAVADRFGRRSGMRSAFMPSRM